MKILVLVFAIDSYPYYVLENVIKILFLKFFPIFYTDSDTNIFVKSSNLCRKPSGKRYRSRMTLYRGATLCIAPGCGFILGQPIRSQSPDSNVCQKFASRFVSNQKFVSSQKFVSASKNRVIWYQTSLNRSSSYYVPQN